MVRVRHANGGYYHEPPYTQEEEADLYARMANVKAFTRPAPPAGAADPQAADPPGPEPE